MNKLLKMSLAILFTSALLVSCTSNSNETGDSLHDSISNAKLVSEYSANTVVDQMDTVTFGSYPQNNKNMNIKDNIEWLVLDRNENRALLLSKYILDEKMFNHESTTEDSSAQYYWNKSSLREWLNSSFLNTAFSDEEKNMIMVSTIDYHLNIEKKGSCDDSIFCLSIPECNTYFGNNNDVQENKKLATKPTKYVVENYEIKKNDGGWYKNNSDYWLRSISEIESDKVFGKDVDCLRWYAAYICSNGKLNKNSDGESLSCWMGVRPAIWVKY